MNTSQQIADRFREVILNGKWIANTNFQDQLSKVTWEQATQQVGSLNSIAKLTFHVQYYITGVADFFESGKLEIHDKFSMDMPDINSEADWQALVNKLMTDSERFAGHVEGMSEEQLEATFISEKYGNYRRNIEAMTEHSYYHLGQVSLIRKMILEG